MPVKGRIGSLQFLFLLLIFDGATAFLYAPAPSVKTAGRDGWLSISLLSMVYAALVLAVVLALARRFPHRVLTEYLPELTGKFLGKLLAAGYTCIFIYLASVVLGQASSFIQIAVLRETPPLVINLILALVAVYGAYLGIEVIARQNELVWPLWTFSILLLAALALKDVNPNNFRPVLENGWMPVAKGSIPSLPYRGETFLILMLFPYLSRKEEASKAAGLYLIITALFNTMALSVTLGVFGDVVTSRLLFPYYELARYISIVQFFERFQSLIVVLWMGGTVVKLAGFYQISAVAAATTFGLADHRPFLLPIFVATILVFSLLFGSFLDLVNFLFSGPVLLFTISSQLFAPVILLLVAVIRKKGGTSLEERP